MTIFLKFGVSSGSSPASGRTATTDPRGAVSILSLSSWTVGWMILSLASFGAGLSKPMMMV